MKCKFCGQENKLIKAHIIPAGFFKRLRFENQSPRLISNIEGEYPKKSPIGVYDSTIVCRQCEDQFGVWDDYAQTLLKDEPLNSKRLFSGTQLVGYELSDIKYTELKLFFISMIWRASVSNHSFFKNIKLGLYEKRAKELIETNNPGEPEEFSIVIAKFNHPLGTTILDPHAEKFSGINYYRFYISGYVVYIKVDKRKSPFPHSQFILSPDKPFYIICRNLERSKELSLIQNIITKS